MPRAAADGRGERARAVHDDLPGRDVGLDRPVDVRLAAERDRDEDDVAAPGGLLVRRPTDLGVTAEELHGLRRARALLRRARADDHVLTCAGDPEGEAEALPSPVPPITEMSMGGSLDERRPGRVHPAGPPWDVRVLLDADLDRNDREVEARRAVAPRVHLVRHALAELEHVGTDDRLASPGSETHVA